MLLFIHVGISGAKALRETTMAVESKEESCVVTTNKRFPIVWRGDLQVIFRAVVDDWPGVSRQLNSGLSAFALPLRLLFRVTYQKDQLLDRSPSRIIPSWPGRGIIGQVRTTHAVQCDVMTPNSSPCLSSFS